MKQKEESPADQSKGNQNYLVNVQKTIDKIVDSERILTNATVSHTSYLQIAKVGIEKVTPLENFFPLEDKFYTGIEASEPDNGELICKDDAIILKYLKAEGIIKNVLTDKYEVSGKELQDNLVNMIAIRARGEQKSISSPRVHEIIKSDLTPSYHPFSKYIESIKDMPLKVGVIQQVLDSLILDNHSNEYKDRIIKKWFGGIMGTLMGSYSVMTLVLIGKQNIGKTRFFRGLLPDLLKNYFVEGAVKDDKDVMSLMCSNLIFYDDEFTSKNKIEANIYKKMSSAPYYTFRRPYDRFEITRKRAAVLAGSANESDVINDHTGNRRILPVRLNSIKIDEFEKINKDEFYRELYKLHQENPVWWHLSDDDIRFMNEETVSNTAIDEYEERALRYTKYNPSGFVSTTEVEAHISKNDYSYRPNPQKLGRALKRIYGDSLVKQVNGKSIRGYNLTLISGEYNRFQNDDLM